MLPKVLELTHTNEKVYLYQTLDFQKECRDILEQIGVSNYYKEFNNPYENVIVGENPHNKVEAVCRIPNPKRKEYAKVNTYLISKGTLFFCLDEARKELFEKLSS